MSAHLAARGSAPPHHPEHVGPASFPLPSSGPRLVGLRRPPPHKPLYASPPPPRDGARGAAASDPHGHEADVLAPPPSPGLLRSLSAVGGQRHRRRRHPLKPRPR